MRLETFVYRINLFGLIWGTIVNLTFALSSGFGSPLGDRAYSSFGAGFASLTVGGIAFFLIGVWIAMPFAFALNVAELTVSEKQRLTAGFVLKVAIPAHFCTFIWFIFGPGTQYGPDGVFSGGLRVGLVGLVAAIVTSYFISRYSPDEVYQESRFAASALLIAELLIGGASLLSPTFQKA